LQKKEKKMKKLVILFLAAIILVAVSVPAGAGMGMVEIETQAGDILLFGHLACQNDAGPNCSDELYLWQAYLVFFQQAAKTAGIYTPLFGEMNTLDLSGFPFEGKGDKYFWGHIEIATGPKTEVDLSGYNFVVVVVMRLKQSPTASVDLGEVVAKSIDFGKTSGGYNQPFLGVVKSFVQLNRRQEGWMNEPGVREKWTKTYGITIGEEEEEEIQYSPSMGTVAHTDIESPKFWERDTDCSARAFWSLVWGWHKNFKNDEVRNLFFNNIKNTNAVDALAPGQVGWWLLKYNLAEVVQIVQ